MSNFLAILYIYMNVYHGKNKLFSKRWWCLLCPCCTRTTCFTDRHVSALVNLIMNLSQPVFALTFWVLVLRVNCMLREGSSQCQFYRLLFDPTRDQTHNLHKVKDSEKMFNGYILLWKQTYDIMYLFTFWNDLVKMLNSFWWI